MLLKQVGMASKKLVTEIWVQAGKKFEFKLFEGMVKAPVQKKLKKSFLSHPWCVWCVALPMDLYY